MSENATKEKELTGRQKEIRILHIMGMILMGVLMVALVAATGIIVRTILSTYLEEAGLLSSGKQLVSTFNEYGMIDGIGGSGSLNFGFIGVLWKIIGAVGYIVAIGALAAAIVLLFLMRKRVENVLSDPTALGNTTCVNKAKYVWLGFLLGGFGVHYFTIGKKKKGLIFLGLGLAGSTIPVVLIYTWGVSFADAYLAAFIPKDSMGMIDLEDYPYWL